MKKITIIIAFCLVANISFAQRSVSNTTGNNTNSVWERVNIGLSYNTTASANFRFGSGFLKNHPDKAIEATGSVRLWNHLEMGGYLSLMGASPFGYSSAQNYNGITFYNLGWDNGYSLSGGAFVEGHLISFAKRNTLDGAIDFTARAGFGLSGQTDGLWCGFGMELRITRQIRFIMNVDYGNFPLVNLKEITDNETNWRAVYGVKISLK